MKDYDITDRKRIAREQVTDDPDHIGRDATGADHFWSYYDQTVVVVENGEVATCELAHVESPLGHWRDHTESDRGWEFHTIIDEPLLAAVV